MKRDLVGLLFLVAVLFVSGCKTQESVDSSDGVRVCRMERRECHFDDAPYAEMSWKEFRPFRVLVPYGVEVKCCCMDEGRMAMSVPGVAAPVIVCVLDRSSDSIGLLIKLHQLAADDSRVRGMLPACDGWYVEKKFHDRRMLMELIGSQSGRRTLQCHCELKSGDCLQFLVRLPSEVEDQTCEQLWRLCRNFKFENKCLDAFNCSSATSSPSADIRPLPRLEWKETGLDLGVCEWKLLRQFQVFMPSSVDVGCCEMDYEHFVFDLPGKRHYVTVDCLGEDSDEIGNQVELYTWSSAALKGEKSQEERMKIQEALAWRRTSGADWFIDKKFSDRRLVIEHRMQGEQCEGLTCYCEFAEGATFRFSVRGSGAIRDEEIDYFLKLCKVIMIKECASTE